MINFPLIIYDFDGTLIKMDVDWKKLKKTMNNIILSSKSNLSESELISIAIAEGDEDKINLIYELIEQFEWEGAKDSTLRISIVDLYKYHSNSEKNNVAILTNNMKKTVINTLKKHRLPEPQILISREDVVNVKPNSEGVLKILNHFHEIPENALLIGDSEVDKIVAKRAKINYLHPDSIK